jgi:rSAM/selenodomain-associated transferase 1
MQARVQVFARAPVSGEVKTRLIPRLGADTAARLQMTLTERAIATAVSADIGPVELWCSPDCAHPTFEAFAARGIALREQETGTIGERMHRALSDALRAGDSAILIGSDCPSLTPQDLRDAARTLHRETDFAFVPAEDGGYALIAAVPLVHSCLCRVFHDVEWGTGRVMDQTRSRLRELGYTWQELATRWDIDRPEDYDRLLREQPDLLK